MDKTKLRGFGALFLSFISAFVGSVFLMGPMMPFMILAPQVYRRVTDHVIGMWLALPVSLLETFFGTKFKTLGHKLVPTERSLIIMNHRTRLDWLFFIACLIRHTRSTNLKIILKNQLKNAPCLGWAMQVACFVFLARQWAKDRVWFTSVLKYFPEMRYDFQLLLFPEGINLCKTGREVSNAYAQKNNLPQYEYVLHPHTTGFAFTVDYLREAKMIDAVYDVTVAYCDKVPEKGELDIYLGNTPNEMEFLVHRHPVTSLPQNKEDLDNWCVEKWKEKETLLQKFYTDKHTFEGLVDWPMQNLSKDKVWFVYYVIAFWLIADSIAFYLLWASPVVFWCSVLIMTTYVILGKYFGGVDRLSIASFNFTQDLTHAARSP